MQRQYDRPPFLQQFESEDKWLRIHFCLPRVVRRDGVDTRAPTLKRQRNGGLLQYDSVVERSQAEGRQTDERVVGSEHDVQSEAMIAIPKLNCEKSQQAGHLRKD